MKTLAVQLDDILSQLPADLTSLIETASLYPESFSHGNIILRLTITLLNETDKRISNMDTKLGVLVLFSVLVRQSPTTKRFMRRVLQNFSDWLDEEISDNEKIGEYALIIQKIKLLFSNIWSVPNDIARSISMAKNESIEVAKTKIINHYAASQFQAISRGFVNRIHVRLRLKAEAENHLVAVRAWSVQKIQKVARGFIARKALYRSRAIRSELSKDVLRMAEKYLLKGDLWGFLRDVNDEMKRAQREAWEVRQQEDDMAGRFVEKVVQLRQTEFDDAWKKFPQAMATFSGKKVEHSLQQPPTNGPNSTRSHILPTSKNNTIMAKKGARVENEQQAVYNIDAFSVSSQSLENTKPLLSPLPRENASMASTQSGFSPARQLSSSVSAKSALSSINADSVIGNASVISLDADPSVSLPGPLLRHAVAATVSGEVQRQLDQLLSGPHKSKQLLQDMKEAYSSSLPGSVSASKHPSGRKKKKVVIGSDGRVVDSHVNKMSAAHSDWMSTAVATTAGGTSSTTASVQPGNSLLLDVPQGSQDSIERILYAAALRCYVPEFFRGHTDSDSVNPNEDPDYAYKMFLKLPHGLAKMKYELECKKWAQGPINRLKIKGLIYLTDTLPVSRFVMSLRSVDTPKILESKAVEIVSLLLRMGKPMIGNRDLHAAKHMSQPLESTTKPPTPQEQIGKNKHQKPIVDDEDEKQMEEKSVSFTSESNSPADELGEQLLLSMLEASGSSSWCSLTASIEDLFLQAAFLVVPNAETYNNHHVNDESQEMGNAAFRSFCASLQALVSESSRRDAVRRRFRSSFILVTPFCLHLKNTHHIHTVQQLLAKGLDVVLEAESGVPPALFTQLEILLGQVVGRCVAAKTVPVPRAQQVRAPDLFTVPMIYDPKFQRSPFDPFGKPPRLQVKVKNKNISGDKSHDGGEEAASAAHHVGKQMKSVPSLSSMSIASDLTEPVSLWGTGSGLASPVYKASSADDSQWSFHLSPAKADQSSIAEENSVASLSSESHSSHHISPTRSRKNAIAKSGRTHTIDAPPAELQNISKNMTIDERDHHDLASLRLDQQLQRTEHSSSDSSLYQDVTVPVYRVLSPMEDRLSSPTMRVTSYNANTAQRLKNQSRGKIKVRISNSGGGETVPKNHSGVVGQGAFIGGVEAHLYKNTFKCTYPHCHQVFSRAYTYKIHLRSHEMFPQYHEFKKKPQLVLDPDKKQVKDIGTEMYTRKVSLPPIVQSDLHSLR